MLTSTAGLLLAAFVLFVIAIRMSAFFSGSETGFYRLNRIRLSIEAQTGNVIAKRLLWFSGMPERFVATALVGNNIANYVATLAIGLMAVALLPENSGLAGNPADPGVLAIDFHLGRTHSQDRLLPRSDAIPWEARAFADGLALRVETA